MKKILTMFFTSAVLVVMCACMVFAQGWAQDENGVWSYTNKDGDKVTEQWVKSGDDFFWLNEDGNMATAQLVNSDALYCVDEKGQMIRNNWVKVNDDNFDDKWLYFGSNGKAYENGWKTIKNEKYHFTDYAMDQGFLDDNGAMIDTENNDAPWLTATYYVGDNGAVKKNYWLAVEDFDSADGKNWVFFGSNGKKVADCKKTINGSTYVFDANGLMVTSFVDATVSSAPVSAYMDADGKMLKKGWVYAYANEDAEEKNWFYAAGNGELVKGIVKNINGKKYAFDADGKMLTGFVAVDTDGKNVVSKIGSAEDVTKVDSNDSSALYAFGDYGDRTYMYFAESATPSEQGAAVTGKTTFNGYDCSFVVNFSNRGLATTCDPDGVVKDNYLYKNSVLVAFEEYDCKYYPVKVDGVEYVWTSKTGKVAKKGTFTDSDNEIQYKFKEDGVYAYTKDAKGKYTVETKVFGTPE